MEGDVPFNDDYGRKLAAIAEAFYAEHVPLGGHGLSVEYQDAARERSWHEARIVLGALRFNTAPAGGQPPALLSAGTEPAERDDERRWDVGNALGWELEDESPTWAEIMRGIADLRTLASRADNLTTPTCCAEDALRAHIADGQGRYVGGYHGDNATADQAAIALRVAQRRHPKHALTQPDSATVLAQRVNGGTT